MPSLRVQEQRPWLAPDDGQQAGQQAPQQDISSLLGGQMDQAEPSGIKLNEAGRSSQGPRENFAPQLRSPSGDASSQAAPQRPEEPTPMAGSTSMAGGTDGVMPFQPMGSPSPSMMAKPQSSSLFGSMGGLQGGGLGVPLDPTPNAASDPITNLIQMLLGRA